MAITRLSGGLTPGDGADPRTFPAIWNATATDLEAGDYSKVPTGGSAGQVLVKDSGTDYDAVWASGLGLGSSRLTNYTASGTTFAYTQPLGLTSANRTFATATVGRMQAHALRVEETTSYDRIAIHIVTAGTDAGDLFRLGVYSPGTTISEHNLILDAGTIAATTTGLKAITIDLTLSRGIYFLVAARQTTGTPANSIVTTGVTGSDPYFARTDLLGFSAGIAGNNNQVGGAFPATTSGVQLYTQSDAPYIALRKVTI